GPQAGAGPGCAAGRQVRRAGTAEQERGEDRGQAGVDLGELEVDGRTAAAAFEVVLDARGVATRQAATDVGAEVVAGPAAVDVVGVGRVLAQERLAESLTGA